MRKTFIVFSFFLFFFATPSFGFAQITESNCVLTKVGNPAGPSPACGPGGGTSITEAADRIRQAYVTCGNPSGTTYDPPKNPTPNSLKSCLRNELSKYNYTDAQLNAFESVRNAHNIAVGCNQCIGYVKSVLALVDSTAGPLPNSGNANSVIFGDPRTLRSGNYVYTWVGEGEEADIKPGDMGVTKIGPFGHILFVKQVKDPVSQIAYQSHWQLNCEVSDTFPVPKKRLCFLSAE
jgi:hypothetical protein